MIRIQYHWAVHGLHLPFALFLERLSTLQYEEIEPQITPNISDWNGMVADGPFPRLWE